MLIINPSVELLPYNGEVVKHVCKCARVCYDKESGNSDERLYDDLIKKHHWSVFRHASYYAIVDADAETLNFINSYWGSPYINFKYVKDKIYIATNGNFILDKKGLDIETLILTNLVSPEEFANTETGHSMMRYSFRVTTQISTSRELNRVSPNNITELSTRYVNLKDGAVCAPHWLINADMTDNSFIAKRENYIEACDTAFDYYNELIKIGMNREDARGVLPLDTATKVIYTYSIDEWKHIIELRSDKRSHPMHRLLPI